MAWTYYIDGYNVIHHADILKSLLRENIEAARDALIEKVLLFCSGTSAKAVIVFDGQGRFTDAAIHDTGVPGLEVVYSSRGLTADAVIERRVYNVANRRNIIVVTADRGIRDLCSGLGTLTMAPDKFLATAKEARIHVTRSLDRVRRSDNFGGVESRLDTGAQERMRKLRERLHR